MPELGYEIYYSKWRSGYQTPWSDEIPQAKNLNLDVVGLNGKSRDSDQWAAKLTINVNPTNDTKLYAEPYFVSLTSPQQTVEGLYGSTVPGDTSLYLNTCGLMLDLQHKGFSLNAEVAGQWGKQEVHSIERDVRTFSTDVDGSVKEFSATLLELPVAAADIGDNATFPANPDVYKYGAGVAATAGQPIDLYQLGYVVMTDEIVNQLKDTTLQRSPNQNGKLLRNPNPPAGAAGAGNMQPYVWPSADGAGYRFIYNQGDWFIGYGRPRFRPAYTLTLKGWMGLLDFGYAFESVPVKLSAALGYISGDNYPYNEEKDKTYRGFLPLRDINYQGHMVKSLAIFTYRLMPRPLNVSTADLLARSNIDDASNLRFFGFGGEYAPLRDKKKLIFNANVLWFWEDAELFKWDKKATLPVPAQPGPLASDAEVNAYAVARAKEDSRDSYGGDSSLLDASAAADLQGWLSSQKASKMLGTELNCQVNYQMTENSDVIFRGGVFIPGQLYKDLDGQPNILTRTWIQNDAEVRRSVGSDWCWAWNVRFQYVF